MTLEEANELSEYFRLINYEDDNTLLEDEFYELERIRGKQQMKERTKNFSPNEIQFALEKQPD